MIDTILHSVGEAEEQADQILREAKKESQRTIDDSVQEAESLWKKQRELFEMKTESGRKLVQQEEGRKDEEAKAEVVRYIEEMKKNAYEKSDQIVEMLVRKII